MLFTPYLTRAGRRRARPAAISIRGALRLLPPADGLEARLEADMERLLPAQAEQQGEQAGPGVRPAAQDEPPSKPRSPHRARPQATKPSGGAGRRTVPRKRRTADADALRSQPTRRREDTSAFLGATV